MSIHDRDYAREKDFNYRKMEYEKKTTIKKNHNFKIAGVDDTLKIEEFQYPKHAFKFCFDDISLYFIFPFVVYVFSSFLYLFLALLIFSFIPFSLHIILFHLMYIVFLVTYFVRNNIL